MIYYLFNNYVVFDTIFIHVRFRLSYVIEYSGFDTIQTRSSNTNYDS